MLMTTESSDIDLWKQFRTVSDMNLGVFEIQIALHIGGGSKNYFEEKNDLKNQQSKKQQHANNQVCTRCEQKNSWCFGEIH